MSRFFFLLLFFKEVLYVLTLVTTLVMPTHLLTGIFGMNWQDEARPLTHPLRRRQNGDPVVPGLGKMEEQRGYYLFWGLALFQRFFSLHFSMVVSWFLRCHDLFLLAPDLLIVAFLFARSVDRSDLANLDHLL